MSIIIDGMDQSTCSIPNVGSQDLFSKPVKMGLTGVKEHGVGLFLYRTVNTVKKGADLTIHCINAQIEAFHQRNGYYPDELYVQADGGGENANKYVLGALELLVVKRIVKQVIFSRLPPGEIEKIMFQVNIAFNFECLLTAGHTHEDIDACFGTLSKCINFLCEQLLTLQDFTVKVEKYFEDKPTMKVKVIDIMLIPNYQKILEPCIDKLLKNLHKEEDTQLQWMFEGVEPCVYFPLGCRTSYRAYCSDSVVEFIKKDPKHCASRIGRAIGLEPVSVACRWYPSQTCDLKNRPGRLL